MSVQDTLIAWGRGKAMDKPENGFPSQAPFARFIVNPGDGADIAREIPPLDLDEHCKVDAVVSEMSRKKPHHFEIICLAYIGRKRDMTIAGALHYSRSTVRAMRENAEFWIDGRLGN